MQIGIRLGAILGALGSHAEPFYANPLGMLFWAMHANPFYSSVVRVQTERGHHTVAAGPYRFVRHPGYAAAMPNVIYTTRSQEMRDTAEPRRILKMIENSIWTIL